MAAMTTAVIEFPSHPFYEWDAEVGKNIKKALIDAGLSQKELASRIGIKQPELSKRCKGRTQFKGSELAAIAAELSVTVTELCTLDYGVEGSWAAEVIPLFRELENASGR